MPRLSGDDHPCTRCFPPQYAYTGPENWFLLACRSRPDRDGVVNLSTIPSSPSIGLPAEGCYSCPRFLPARGRGSANTVFLVHPGCSCPGSKVWLSRSSGSSLEWRCKRGNVGIVARPPAASQWLGCADGAGRGGRLKQPVSRLLFVYTVLLVFSHNMLAQAAPTLLWWLVNDTWGRGPLLAFARGRGSTGAWPPLVGWTFFPAAATFTPSSHDGRWCVRECVMAGVGAWRRHVWDPKYGPLPDHRGVFSF